MSCYVCEQRRSEGAQEIPSDVSIEDEDHLKKCFEAIGKAHEEVLTQLSLCSHHFSQACSAGLILTNNAAPTLAPTSSDSIAKAAEVDRSSPQRESDSEQSPSPLSPFPIRRPIITRGRRTRMLPQEEVEIQPFKHVRYLKSVNWDEISKVPGEAKIVWEVAMEELKENNDKIKHLQAQVHQLSAIVQKLKNTLKTQKKTETTANDFS
ncbi:uncharacterized protein LOC105832010 [Monomorium pharaonis]|uniref:uncharacterized protein LOC105832010 n=1 Tax=Monomorium pharaonis TaxID=307658 RepID=UPI00063FA27B|nr:uncharacterized protein LOC105832010 [Monomorium pharaonis]